MVVDKPDVKRIALWCKVNAESLSKTVLYSDYWYVILLLAEWNHVLPVLNCLLSSVSPQFNVRQDIAGLIIKFEQFSIDMIFLEKCNGTFSYDSSRSYSFSNQLNDVECTFLLDLIENQLLFDDLMWVFCPFNLYDFLNGGIQVLQINFLINW